MRVSKQEIDVTLPFFLAELYALPEHLRCEVQANDGCPFFTQYKGGMTYADVEGDRTFLCA